MTYIYQPYDDFGEVDGNYRGFAIYIPSQEGDLDMFLTSVEIHKVENGYVITASKELSEEEYKKELEKNKKTGCCVSNVKHSSLVFNTIDDIVAYLKSSWS